MSDCLQAIFGVRRYRVIVRIVNVRPALGVGVWADIAESREVVCCRRRLWPLVRWFV